MPSLPTKPAREGVPARTRGRRRPLRHAAYRVVLDGEVARGPHHAQAPCSFDASRDLVRDGGRSALDGQIIVDLMCCVPAETAYLVTASQVIHDGYRCFTYEDADLTRGLHAPGQAQRLVITPAT